MPLCTLWSMGLTEGVVQRVDMSLSTNKLACVLASIIGVPCNVPLPRAVLCVPMAVLNEGSQGFNGTPVGFKQTQGDPLLFSMLHRTAGSPQGSHSGAGNPRGGPRARCLLPIVPLMTSSQELDTNSFQTSFSGLIARCGAKSQRAVGRNAVLVCDWLLGGNVGQKFTVKNEEKDECSEQVRRLQL
ncbi:hypothetical protein PBY51_015674 [Eleginops maclovinus]|uniref:Uncharacterized protein n=2 Tax=Eleginops maclovinus TaxID=56733 RepID=A0AAN8AJ08_ELEMC|nr:hypothetical protein PBY51_015674 [Eleginops maclovinus]